MGIHGKRRRRSAARGQTMMEAIVACGIIITSVSAALTLVQSSINAAKASETRLVASNLAREGLEAIRSIRDSNWLMGNEWDDGLHEADEDYTGIPVFDVPSKTWSIDFEVDSMDHPRTTVFRVFNPSGAYASGLMVQGSSAGGNTLATPYKRMVYMRPMCRQDLGAQPNFIAYEIRDQSESCPNNKEKIGIEAQVFVSWTTSGGQEHNISVAERIFNWR